MLPSKDPFEIFRKFIDDVKTRAFQRGIVEPEWADVWMAMCANSNYSFILFNKGIDTASLLSDINFISRFGIRGDSDYRLSENSHSALFNEVKQEVLIDILVAVNAMKRNAPREFDDHVQDFFHDVVHRSQALLGADPKNGQKFHLKALVVARVLEQISKKITLLGPDAQAVAELLQVIAEDMIKDRHPLKQASAVSILETFIADPMHPPSGLETVEKIMALTKAEFNDLWHRNGLLTGPDEPVFFDRWANLLPSERLAGLAQSALHSAYTHHSRALDAKHIVLELLNDRTVQVHLAKLGVKDQLDLQNKFAAKLFAAEIESESKARSHPRIDDSTIELLWKLDDTLKGKDQEGRKAPEALRYMMARFPDIDKAMNEAGLRRRMLKAWGDAYNQKDAKDQDEPNKKKKKEFEIFDLVLNELIKSYCTDLTDQARKGKFDPMVGNEPAMDQAITTLLKRGKKNPLVIGEPGIGKSKLSEGFALRVVKGNVPPGLIGARVLMVDLHSMDDTSWKGMFESRILPILKGISERNAAGLAPTVLVLDEFGHSMDAGAHAAGDGIKGLIKPYLASGDLMVIANTTRKEYQTKLKKDGAITRRFNVVSMVAPTDQETAEILLKNKGRYSSHHKIRIPNYLCGVVATMAGRYLPHNQPDKAIDLLDLSCAMAVKAGVKTLDRSHINTACSSMSNIPKSYFSEDEKDRYINLEPNLNKEVIEQSEAAGAVAAALKRSKTGLRDPQKPIGNFLFVGPTGVGKTEMTKALARLLFGDESLLTRFDMSEYMEKHSVSRLIGAPPGYVGFDEGGLLITTLQDRPHGVLLFDEVEKAHADVFNALLGPFDNGIVTDGRGEKGNMRECLNIMTSNLGQAEVRRLGEASGIDPVRDAGAWNIMAAPIYMAAVKKFFRPEFLNRLDGVIVFNGLSRDGIDFLVDRRIDKTKQRLRENYNGLGLGLTPEFQRAIADKGFDPLNGARPLDRAVKGMLETPLADYLLRTPKKQFNAGRMLFAQAVHKEVDLGELSKLARSPQALHALIEKSGAMDVHFSLI